MNDAGYHIYMIYMKKGLVIKTNIGVENVVTCDFAPLNNLNARY